jgi:hypothetical protein
VHPTTPARNEPPEAGLTEALADRATTQPPSNPDALAGPAAARDSADAVIALGRLALRFGRVNRITYHDDGVTPESDTDHTVMLGLIACAFAAAHLPQLDLGLIAQYALVHDLVEVYAGDTPTLHPLSAQAKAAKLQREHDAWTRLHTEFDRTLPWVPDLIAGYEARTTPGGPLCQRARQAPPQDHPHRQRPGNHPRTGPHPPDPGRPLRPATRRATRLRRGLPGSVRAARRTRQPGARARRSRHRRAG